MHFGIGDARERDLLNVIMEEGESGVYFVAVCTKYNLNIIAVNTTSA